MGFWEEDHKNKKILVSDEGLDICFESVEKFHSMYKEHLDRGPTLEEFLKTLLIVMNTSGDSYFPELNDKQIVDLKTITKKVKSTAKVIPGAIIQIPLKKIDKYTYAWVIKGDLSKNKDDDILIQYYDIFTDKELSRGEVISSMKEERKLFVANTGYTGLLQGDWNIISKMPRNIIEKTDSSQIKFIIFEEGKYLMSEGDSFASEDQLIELDEKTGRKIVNPLGIFGHLSIESILYKYYKGITMEEIIKNEL